MTKLLFNALIVIYISYNEQIINKISKIKDVDLINIYISYNEQIINIFSTPLTSAGIVFTFHIMNRL